MKMLPVRLEYEFEALNHSFRGSVEHIAGRRKISYYFDENLISQKDLPDGPLVTDDDCICEIVQAYSRSHVDVFADLFGKHADKVHLLRKTVAVQIENGFFLINATVVSERDKYTITLYPSDGDDVFTGTFRAVNFSEALEKMRIFISTLEGISEELSQNISEFSNDAVQRIIQWQ